MKSTKKRDNTPILTNKTFWATLIIVATISFLLGVQITGNFTFQTNTNEPIIIPIQETTQEQTEQEQPILTQETTTKKEELPRQNSISLCIPYKIACDCKEEYTYQTKCSKEIIFKETKEIMESNPGIIIRTETVMPQNEKTYHIKITAEESNTYQTCNDYSTRNIDELDTFCNERTQNYCSTLTKGQRTKQNNALQQIKSLCEEKQGTFTIKDTYTKEWDQTATTETTSTIKEVKGRWIGINNDN
jgi:hypothetical protein